MGFDENFKINKNVFEISFSKAKALYNSMKPVKKDEREKIESLIEGMKDLSIQIGKIIYPSHYNFLTLNHGYFEKGGEKVYVYITRLDGKDGVIPNLLAEKSGIEEIIILEIQEASTSKREPKGGYYFSKPKEDMLLRFKVIATTPKEEYEITNYEELKDFYFKLSKAMKTIYRMPEIQKALSFQNDYRRDGYL
ncbi:MAG TPA: hypothetical protein EYH56_02810 [Nanoarchaeota archaeon]|nr:hypothetical protein [Nanoarchaeota archaeon]